MRRLRPGPRAVGGALIAVVLGALGTQGPFAGPGYEMALAAGLLCPATAAAVAAVDGQRPLQPFGAFCRALETGLLFAAIGYAVAFLHGLRAGFCDLWEGTMMFALGPTVGTLLGAVWGAVAAELGRRRKRPRLAAALFGIALPLASVLVQLGFFYATPMVFAYDPFAGYFSGALYDTVLADGALFEYRLASAATLGACYMASLHLERREDGRVRYRSLGRPGMLVFGALLAGGSATSVAFGPELGHWQTEASIAKALGGEMTVGRCRVIFDTHIARAEVDRFGADCDAHVTQVGRWLALDVRQPVTAYLFFDRGQKRVLMGAGRVSVAKPWRREVYLQNEEYPHDVVGHELVHALTADIGAGPFKVAPSPLTSLIPNPGLVEGIAVAASPRDDNLSHHEWAAAMRKIGVLPTLDALFGLSFFGQASSTAYTASASFVDQIREDHGIEVVKRWYGGGDLPALTGQSWQALEQVWWARLDTIRLSDAALATAKLRFDQPSVFERSCPHVVDEVLGEADARVGGDNDGAIARFTRVLELDPANLQAQLGIARCHEKSGDVPGALDRYQAISEHPGVTRAERLSAAEKKADLLLRGGDVEAAVALYREVMTSVTEEGRLRTLEIKVHYAPHPLGRPALVALLIGSDTRGPDTTEALDRIGAWRAANPADGTPLYLLARQHFTAGNWALAIERLEAALALELPVPRSRSEALRLLLIAACAVGDHARAVAALDAYVAHPLVTESKADTARSLHERCTTPAPQSTFRATR